MRRLRFAAMTLAVVAAFLVFSRALPTVALAQAGQQKPNIPSGVLLEPLGTRGEAVYPAFEGWGR